ncbi:sugar ABC transporter substrate-binding protein [Actinomyces sp. Z5]|uniref:ABC transporter substrate-binding protein n=1 Tax=Actinomyces sp. Z5 TaxID=2250216 RepID=UPI000DCBA84C|nr:sugar ABC transporter substrate-binding protein [Actinomyces sp. Z5]MBE6474569.1 sugar ABC transporter substrate-binding protein [Actinomyces succiniciruminis]RAX23648.1 sugar ABC transporter substrate-binding protein [Actinomyces sp. Z5]
MSTRMMTRRSLVRTTAVVSALVAAGGLTACGSKSGGSGASEDVDIPAEGTDDGTTLTMWSRAPLERQVNNAVDAYNAGHKNQVKVELLPNDDVEGKVGAAIQSDGLPDILAGDVVRIPYWVQQGVFRNMTEQINGLNNLANLQQGHIDAGTVDDKKYTLPFVTDISVMVWNKDLYREAGLDPEVGPTTLAEFKAQATAVAGLGKDNVAGTYTLGSSGGGLTFTIFPMLWGNGEEVLSEDGMQSYMASASAKRIYSAFNDLAKLDGGIGAGSQEETGATWTAPFAEGRVGVMPYAYTSVAALFDTADFEIGVCAIPGIDGGSSTFLGGDAIGISRNCTNPAQAWNFISWLMTDEAQQQVFADNNDTASSLTVLDTGYKDADERTRIANATIANGRTPVAVNYAEAFNAAGSPWQLLIQNAIWGDGSQIDAQNDAINAVLAQ